MAKKVLSAKLASRKPARKGASASADAKKPAKLAPIRCETTLAAVLDALRAADPALVERMLAEAGPPPLRARTPDFAGLAWIVVGQQVSTASARAIHARLEAGFPGMVAAEIAAASDEALRACGLSAPKIRTIRALADAILGGRLDFDALARMEASEAHAALVALHGVGPWTADLFLLSCLGHPDAWPAGDLALQEAARLLLGLRARPDAKALTRIGERWRPARAVAARLLWAWYGARKQAAARAP